MIGGDDPDDLVELREMFKNHMKGYEKIFTLRALRKAPDWIYELVEIPKTILEQAMQGRLEMKS